MGIVMFLGVEFNIVSLIVAAIVSFLVGMFWHHDAVFGKTLRKLSGAKKIKKKDKSQALVIQFIASLATVAVLSYFMSLTGAVALTSAAKTFRPDLVFRYYDAWNEWLGSFG